MKAAVGFCDSERCQSLYLCSCKMHKDFHVFWRWSNTVIVKDLSTPYCYRRPVSWNIWHFSDIQWLMFCISFYSVYPVLNFQQKKCAWMIDIGWCSIKHQQYFTCWMMTRGPSVLWRCWLGGRKGIRPVKREWWGAGMVICLERGADLHIAQLMPLPLTVSCFSKIQIGFTFLVPAHLGSPEQRAVKRACVNARVYYEDFTSATREFCYPCWTFTVKLYNFGCSYCVVTGCTQDRKEAQQQQMKMKAGRKSEHASPIKRPIISSLSVVKAWHKQTE